MSAFFLGMANHLDLLLCMQPRQGRPQVTRVAIQLLNGTLHSPVSFQTTPADSLLQRTETVGKIQPHAKAKLINTKGEIVPIGTPGEICISGYLLQKGFVCALVLY